eukprot:1159686-Pelagomonas_calceolata.AAC.8
MDDSAVSSKQLSLLLPSGGLLLSHSGPLMIIHCMSLQPANSCLPHFSHEIAIYSCPFPSLLTRRLTLPASVFAL